MSRTAEQQQKLDRMVIEPSPIDGDIALLTQLIDRIERGEFEDNLPRLKREVGKLKARILWDDIAQENGTEYTIKEYGSRP